MPTTAHTDEAAIRERAHALWEQDGRPEGRDTEYWMRAKVVVSDKSEMDSLTAPPPRPGAKPAGKKPKGK